MCDTFFRCRRQRENRFAQGRKEIFSEYFLKKTEKITLKPVDKSIKEMYHIKEVS